MKFWCFGLERRRQRGGIRMNVLKRPSSGRAERRRAERLDIARRLYRALTARDPDRMITLRDSSGKVVARHDLRPEEDTQQSVFKARSRSARLVVIEHEQPQRRRQITLLAPSVDASDQIRCISQNSI